jgi:hypothetical protein
MGAACEGNGKLVCEAGILKAVKVYVMKGF